MRYRIEFFQMREFRCPCCGRAQVAAALAVALDITRRAWAAPIRVNSGWRCPAHNREVGGAVRSRHLLGCAADIRPQDPALINPFQTLVGELWGRWEGWELRMYPRFVHLAVPRDETAHLWEEGPLSIGVIQR